MFGSRRIVVNNNIIDFQLFSFLTNPLLLTQFSYQAICTQRAPKRPEALYTWDMIFIRYCQD